MLSSEEDWDEESLSFSLDKRYSDDTEIVENEFKRPRLDSDSCQKDDLYLNDKTSIEDTKIQTNDNYVSNERLAELSALIDQCSHDELLHIQKTIKPLLKRDFITQLPVEISLRILNYLSPYDLFRCSQVSRSWSLICSDRLLWYRQCRRVGLSESSLNCSEILSQEVLCTCRMCTHLHTCITSHSNQCAFTNNSNNVICSTSTFTNRSEFQNSFTQSSTNLNLTEVDWKLLYHHHAHTQCNWRHGGPLTPIVSPAHHNHVITCLEVYKDWAITGSDDSSICVWNLNDGQCLISLFGHLGGVWSMTILTPQQLSKDKSIIVGNNNCCDNNDSLVNASFEYPLLISGSCDRTARVWQLDGNRWPCITTLFGHQSIVRCVAGQKFYFKQKFIDNENINSTEINQFCQSEENDSVKHSVNSEKELSMAKLKNMVLVVTGSRDTTLRLWNCLSGECIQEFRGHRGAIRCVQFTGYRIVSGSYDCTVRLWCIMKGICLRIFSAHTNRVYTLLFDGSHIISGSLDTTIRVWEAESGKLDQTFYGHRSLTSEMAYGHAQNILVSSNADETIRVWHIKTGKCIHVLAGSNKHQSAVTCVQLTRNFIVSSGDDGTVKLWDRKSGCYIRDLLRLDGAGRGGVIWRIVASEDRLVCAAGSRNGMESTKLVVIRFDEHSSCPYHSNKSVYQISFQMQVHTCRPKLKHAPVPRLSQIFFASNTI